MGIISRDRLVWVCALGGSLGSRTASGVAGQADGFRCDSLSHNRCRYNVTLVCLLGSLLNHSVTIRLLAMKLLQSLLLLLSPVIPLA